MIKIGVNTLVKNILNLPEKKYNKKSTISGINLHKDIENYLKSENKIIPEIPGRKREILIKLKEFLDDYKQLIFLESEKKIYFTYKNIEIVGVIDALFFDNKNTIYIIDWKTIYDISSEDYIKYSFVLEIYKKILKKSNPKQNFEIILVLLHEDRFSYVCVPCISESRTLENILDQEMQKIIK